MSFATRSRVINPRLGTYFGIFASLFAALVMLLLILEQLGTSDTILRTLMFIVPLVLFAAIGLASWSNEAIDFYASGRRVPAFFNGFLMATGAVGGTGIVAITGLFFLHGIDAWSLVIGLTSGFVVMAILIAPFLRKFGAFTVPSYLGRRFESPLVRLIAAAIVAVPMLLVISAELRIGVFAATWLTGQPEALAAGVLVIFVIVTLVPGGMRGLTWSSTAQAIAAVLAFLVPAAMVAVMVTNLPLPPMSYGPVLRSIGRVEAILGVPIPRPEAFAFDFGGQAPHAIVGRFADPFSSIGSSSFTLLSFTLMAGVASAPWLLPRIGTTPGVYEARKCLGWATFLVGMIMLTASAIAVFMRDIVTDTLVGHSESQLPAWFKLLAQSGLAEVHGSVPRLPISSFSFSRDSILFALPIAVDYPAIFLYLALTGAVAAALVAASAGIFSLASVLSEDVMSGLGPEPPHDSQRIAIARVALAGVAVAAFFMTLYIPADPLDLILWAFAISGSALFPVLVLSIWWKRVNSFAALIGMTVGFTVAATAILAGEAGSFSLSGALAGAFGIPASVCAVIIGTWLSPAPSKPILELVRDLRVPGGETIYDREVRRLRRKQRSRV
jgi:cation/acetate symporter